MRWSPGPMRLPTRENRGEDRPFLHGTPSELDSVTLPEYSRSAARWHGFGAWKPEKSGSAGKVRFVLDRVEKGSRKKLQEPRSATVPGQKAR